ncbi:MAG: hypothetical protein CME32_05650 [Gimesia sp.]|nr:hypothetical protein [Gimesia sp.]
MSETSIEIGAFSSDLNGDQAISAQNIILQALVDGSANQQVAQAHLALGYTKVSQALLNKEITATGKYTADIQAKADAIKNDSDKSRAKDQAAMQADQAQLQAITTNANGIDTTNKSMSDQANSNAQNLSSSLQDYSNVATKATSMIASLVSSLVPSLG